MRTAIFSDLHDRTVGFRAVIRHAQRHNVDRFVYLGDVGNDGKLFELLRGHEISCTFGNWEVSGLRRFPPERKAWVATWPAQIEMGDVCFTHATPDLPAAVVDTASAATYMAQGIGWHQLFPRLNHNEEARWGALAALESSDRRAAFHGHTHIQQVWVYSARRWRSFYGPAEFTLEEGTAEEPTRYLIGVGSAGEPQDGSALRYAIYDDRDKRVQLFAIRPND